MDYELCVPAIVRRAEQLFPGKAILSRRADGGWQRSTYADVLARAKQLGRALQDELGLVAGDRVATLCWNHADHLVAYLGVPASGLVVHTLNPRLHPDDLSYIASHAGDRVLVADKSLWQLVEATRPRSPFEHVIAVGEGPTPDGAIELDALLADRSSDVAFPDLDERSAAAMCYTSGTTGRPKGVLYSHRAIVLHSL
ncbi:MAG: long-chain fatty acid--CoA ligase, partial [Actinobacteria bacterium]|nr:long-chain fatty acid--CoA ligase [Actinomycetota bacterium]